MKDEKIPRIFMLSDQKEDPEKDPGMVALDNLTNKVLKVPKAELDKRVADEREANRLKRERP